MTDQKIIASLAKLREPFQPRQISKLPKPTKNQTDSLKEAMKKKDFSLGIRCKDCGAWHHKDVAHLDYVGHAALTDRLLQVDPMWNWEFVSVDDRGLPVIDNDGGFWITLTVCGVKRLGYGDAQGKVGGNAMKERIGDALRNAGMRFGCALDLWHKGDLHPDNEELVDISEGSSLDENALAWIAAYNKNPKCLDSLGSEHDEFKQLIIRESKKHG